MSRTGSMLFTRTYPRISELVSPSSSIANALIVCNPEAPQDAVTAELGPDVVIVQFWSKSSGYHVMSKSSLSDKVSSPSISRVATTSSFMVHVPSSAGRYGIPSTENLISPIVGATFRTS